VSRDRAGAPVFSRDFKKIVRRDPSRPFCVELNNGACGPVAVWLTAGRLADVAAEFTAALAIKGKEDVMVKMGKFAVLDEDDALRLLAGEHLRIPEGVEVLALRDYVPELAAFPIGQSAGAPERSVK
jgi:hypothetical protein